MLDLFSGIGGFALAAEWVWQEDLEIVGFCEIEPYCQKLLKQNFPGVKIYNDITKLDGKSLEGVDLITGGFPCQDISVAGKGVGIEGKRSGLWSEMYRIISEVRPKYAIIENVPMLLHRGLERVLCDLAEGGFDAEWQIIGADDVGARHRRKRIWIVAYPRHLCRGDDVTGDVGLCSGEQSEATIGSASQPETTGSGEEHEAMAHTKDGGRKQTKRKGRKGSKRGSSNLRGSQGEGKEAERGLSNPTGIGLHTEEDKQVLEGKRGSELLPLESGSLPDSEHDGSYGSEERRSTVQTGNDNKKGKKQSVKSKGVYKSKGKGDLSGSKSPDTDIKGVERSARSGDFKEKGSYSYQFTSRHYKGGDYWAAEPILGRVANGVPRRVDRLKGLGNAIVPLCVVNTMVRVKDLIEAT
jgi:DNA-cytosine methyltransferase